ncbi:MAG: hypothetical protein HDS07_01760 [Bacteroides sp.]|nr:hypothetical protein [Bacteroides sp.]
MEILSVLLILAIIIIPIGIHGNRETKKKIKAREDYLTSKYGAITKKIEDVSPNIRPQFVYVFEEAKVIVIGDKEYKFDSILDFSVNGGQSYKVTTSTSSALGRGIVGGVLFGGIGALAGAGTASKKTKPNETRYLISITTKELANPMIEYRTIYETKANELISVLKIIIDRTNSEHK